MASFALSITQKEHVNGAVWEFVEIDFPKIYQMACAIGVVTYYFTNYARMRITTQNGFVYSKGEFKATNPVLDYKRYTDQIALILDWDCLMHASFRNFIRCFPDKYVEMADTDTLTTYFPEDFREIYEVGLALQFRVKSFK